MYTNINIISSWPARCWPCLFTLLREFSCHYVVSSTTHNPQMDVHSIITVTTYLVEMHHSSRRACKDTCWLVISSGV